jgi:hypothetical protein
MDLLNDFEQTSPNTHTKLLTPQKNGEFILNENIKKYKFTFTRKALILDLIMTLILYLICTIIFLILIFILVNSYESKKKFYKIILLLLIYDFYIISIILIIFNTLNNTITLIVVINLETKMLYWIEKVLVPYVWDKNIKVLSLNNFYNFSYERVSNIQEGIFTYDKRDGKNKYIAYFGIPNNFIKKYFEQEEFLWEFDINKFIQFLNFLTKDVQPNINQNNQNNNNEQNSNNNNSNNDIIINSEN